MLPLYSIDGYFIYIFIFLSESVAMNFLTLHMGFFQVDLYQVCEGDNDDDDDDDDAIIFLFFMIFFLKKT